MRTRWRRLLDVDDAEHLRGVAELSNLDGAHIHSSPSRVAPLCDRLPTEPTNQRLLPLVAWLLTQRTVETPVYALGVVDDREVVEESVHVGDGGGAGVCLESTFEGLVESFELSMGLGVARVPVLLGDAEACE
jgi:hypothetical protein